MKHVIFTILMSLSAWQAFAIDGYNGSPTDLQSAVSAKENVLLIFGASWCGPCQRMKQNVWSHADFQAFTDEKQVKRFYIDIDQHRPTAQQYSVTSIPTWFVISDGQITARSGSVGKDQVKSIIASNIVELTPAPVFEPFDTSAASLEEAVTNNENVLLVFGSTSCGICAEMKANVWDQVEFLKTANSLNVKKFYIDINEQVELTEKYNVTATPSFFTVKEGQVSSVQGQSTLEEVNSLLAETFTIAPVIPTEPYSDSLELLQSSLDNKQNFILIFGATWCGPCQRMKKNVWSVQDFLDFSNNLGLTRFYFDTDQFKALKDQFGVTSIPSWFIIKDGQISSKNGSASKADVESLLLNTFQ